MFNVHKFITPVAVAAVVLLTGCSGNKARTEAADNLLRQASALVEKHDYDSAMTVLDTLDVKYRDCLDQRRQGTVVRLTALSALTRDSLASAEIQYRHNQELLESLAPEFKKIDVAGTDGYFVDKSSFTGGEMNSTGVQARVDDEGYLFIVANLYGKKIGLDALSAGGVTTAKGESVAIEGSEIMSLSQEKTAEFIDRLLSMTPPVKIEFIGTRGSVSATLNAAAIKSIAATREYARALQTNRRLAITLEKLERQLAKISDNLARQLPADDVKE